MPTRFQTMNAAAAETAGDAALLTAYARSGCEVSFRRLVDRHAGLVFHTAQRVVGQAALAQDVAQRNRAVIAFLPVPISRLIPSVNSKTISDPVLFAAALHEPLAGTAR